MFQYRRESGEEVVRGFRVFAAEAERARDEHRGDGQPRRDTVGKQARVLDRKRRHEHEREVIDDVIESPAVEHRRALLDAGEARQNAVDCVDHRGDREPEKCNREVAIYDADERDVGDERAARRERMNQPGHGQILLVFGRYVESVDPSTV